MNRQDSQGPAGTGKEIPAAADETAAEFSHAVQEPSATLAAAAIIIPYGLWLLVTAGALAGRPPTAPIELETLASAWHMARTGGWVPLRNGEFTPQVAPLQDWLIIGGWRLFGADEWWPRLLSAIASLMSIALTAAIAKALWPHRSTTPLFARILLIGVAGLILSATLVQPETLALPMTLVGVLVLAKLWQQRRPWPTAVLLWAVFAAALIANLFLVGWSALLLLPVLGLAAPLAHEAETAPRDGGLSLGWHLPLILATLPAIVLAGLWLDAAAPGKSVSFFAFGNGWIDPATEATRREAWSLLLAPALLYPWICWKTLWRALDRHLRGRLGPGFRLCLIYFGAAILSSLVAGEQLQGLLPVVPPLTLLGARLLATQEIKPKDFHAVVPGFIALVIGLIFFLMNMIPTAHLDAVWRQFFDAPLPIWLGGSGLASGLVLLVSGYVLAQLSPSQQLARTIQVAFLPALLVTCLNIEFAVNLRQFFDLTPTAGRLKDLQEAGQEIAVYGPYRGEFDFYGQLERAPVVLPSLPAALAWARAHPMGAVVSYFDGSPIRLPGLPYFRGVARDRWVAIWPSSAVVDSQGSVLAASF